MTDYTSEYPYGYSETYVKATSKIGTSYYAHYATDPSKSLTGGISGVCWVSNNQTTQQRFHIDLGEAKIITRIYYENFHESGGDTNRGIYNCTFWGSNDADSFATLTYATDTGWTQITGSQSTFDQHVAANQVDPKYITLTNTTGYRYYAIKIADCRTGSGYMGVRRIELQSGGSVELSFGGVSLGSDNMMNIGM